MTITGIRDEEYRLLDINAGVTVSDDVKADCANALNKALQMMSLAGGDFFLSESVTQAITANTATYTLGATIQRVIGPVRMSGGEHLRELRNKGQYQGYGTYLAGGTTMTAAAGSPRAFYLDTNKATTGADAVEIVLCLCPAPAADGSVVFDVIKEPTAYTAANLDTGTTTIPVAHQYTESILIPLVKYFLSRSRFFTNSDKLPLIETDYHAALAALGLADPVENPVRKTIPDLEEAA